jgi:hypothetical protein
MIYGATGNMVAQHRSLPIQDYQLCSAAAKASLILKPLHSRCCRPTGVL